MERSGRIPRGDKTTERETLHQEQMNRVRWWLIAELEVCFLETICAYVKNKHHKKQINLQNLSAVRPSSKVNKELGHLE